MPLPSDMPLTTIDGKSAALGDFAGRALLIVNVASQVRVHAAIRGARRPCIGAFASRGFAVLGFPCDQFGHQEPGDEAEIKKFCADKLRRHVPDVRQDRRQRRATPIRSYQGAEEGAPGLLGTQAIKWNFTKFLVDRQRRAVRRYAPAEQAGKADLRHRGRARLTLLGQAGRLLLQQTKLGEGARRRYLFCYISARSRGKPHRLR